MNLNTTLSFTGHRDYDISSNELLYTTLLGLYEDGYRVFLSGMAVGFDMAAAEAVLRLRQLYSDVELVCVVPFRGQEQRFSTEDKVRYHEIIDSADSIEILAEHYFIACYAVRNNYLLDNSSCLVAYYDGSKGGTNYTFRRAVKSNHRVINIYESSQMSLFD